MACERAVQPDRPVVAGGAQQRDQPLGLAEAVGADEMRALGKRRERGEQPADLARVGLVAEHRQPEGGLGDEEVAAHELEGRRGRIGAALVVAGDHGAAAPMLDHHLGAAEDVAGRHQPHRHAAHADRLAVAQLLEAAGRLRPEPRPHDGDGLRRRQHRAVAGPRMIGMAVGDDGALDRAASGRCESRRARSTGRRRRASASPRIWRSATSGSDKAGGLRRGPTPGKIGTLGSAANRSASLTTR